MVEIYPEINAGFPVAIVCLLDKFVNTPSNLNDMLLHHFQQVH